MVNAVVLIKAAPAGINDVAEKLAAVDGVSEVYSVGGRFDIVAILRVKDNEALAEVVTERFLKVEGITDSETLIAYRAHSRHDLERMFSVGMD